MTVEYGSSRCVRELLVCEFDQSSALVGYGQKRHQLDRARLITESGHQIGDGRLRLRSLQVGLGANCQRRNIVGVVMKNIVSQLFSRIEEMATEIVPSERNPGHLGPVGGAGISNEPPEQFLARYGIAILKFQIGERHLKRKTISAGLDAVI